MSTATAILFDPSLPDRDVFASPLAIFHDDGFSLTFRTFRMVIVFRSFSPLAG
jgi:hypothetical protein